MTSKKDIDSLVGANIKRERERANFTQEKFAEMIGIGPKSLSAIERGTVGISLPALRRILYERFTISSDEYCCSVTAKKTDVQVLEERLSRLSPAQFEIANHIMSGLLAAFALPANEAADAEWLTKI